MDKFERGSEWRKWDLHVHTKGTNKNDNFTSSDFEAFCVTLFKKALEKNIRAIGITDYFSIDNYKKVKEYAKQIDSVVDFEEQEREKIKNILLLPNVELRILPATGSGGLINIHCLFNPDDTFIETLENNFFGSLDDSGGNKMNRAGLIALGKEGDVRLNDEGAYKRGIEGFHLEPSKLIKLFKDKAGLKENTIIAVSNSNNDGASALQQHYKLFENENGSLNAVRSNIYKLSDAIFSGNPSDREFFLGEKSGCDEQIIISKCGSLKPCIHGSDAHCEDKLFNPDENRFCWIKVDLTFEGLKQILCEPKDRVKIQANKPEEKSGYHVIKSIEIDSDICKQNILLNPNLNTIIGGRSTGKSTLLQIIAHRINSIIPGVKPFISDIPQDSIKIIWQDDEENKDRDIEFFPQSHMYEIARNKEKKNKLIQDIVEEKDDKSLIKSLEKFCANNKSTLQRNLDDLFELKANIDELATALKEKGDESGLRKEIESLQNKIKESQQNNSVTEDELKQYETLKDEVFQIEQLLQKQEGDKSEIAVLKDEDLFDSSFLYKFNQLSDSNSKAIQEIFTSVKQKAVEEWQGKLSVKLAGIDESIDEYKKVIRNKKGSDTFKKGSSQLDQNKQYKELNDRLIIENKKLAEITSLQNKISNIDKQKDELFRQAVKNHFYYSTKTDELIRDFSLIHDDIEIKIEKIYRQDKCKELLKDFINLQSHDRQSFVNDWGDKYQADAKLNVEWFLQKALENKIELKAYKDIKDLAKGLLTENWFSISYDLTYQNDTFNKMSDGKKSFVILKLLLEFSHKECPILIDQPEDSLDNRAIYNELVAYLKQKKKVRQIILVTHNANIVVNADAEEVIVANQHGEDSKNQGGIKFQYITGSLENTKLMDKNLDIVLQSQGIREHVCEILEGGTEAFKKRENKYAIA
jgi:ABC-type nitrate/sulfonate/bicarbonate transport system ATPase subunit|tara:strand:+ start:230 stop:2995 length:2766 start_codon:yes stop_codon:yes gene_type:complete